MPKAGLDFVDRGEHLPGDPVLGSAGLVDRQQEGRDLEGVDDEVGDADRRRAERRDHHGRVLDGRGAAVEVGRAAAGADRLGLDAGRRRRGATRRCRPLRRRPSRRGSGCGRPCRRRSGPGRRQGSTLPRGFGLGGRRFDGRALRLRPGGAGGGAGSSLVPFGSPRQSGSFEVEEAVAVVVEAVGAGRQRCGGRGRDEGADRRLGSADSALARVRRRPGRRPGQSRARSWPRQ